MPRFSILAFANGFMASRSRPTLMRTLPHGCWRFCMVRRQRCVALAAKATTERSISTTKRAGTRVRTAG